MVDRMSDLETDCVFCRTAQGRESASMVYEDEVVVAFWDARPAAKIHILIVPREHVPTLNDVREDSNILSHIGQVAVKIAKEFGVAQHGYRLILNVNRGGGQVIFHLHAHLVSRGSQ